MITPQMDLWKKFLFPVCLLQQHLDWGGHELPIMDDKIIGSVQRDGYSTVSMDAAILIFAMARKGMVVDSRQAIIEMTAASAIVKYGIAVNCKLSVRAAFTKIVQRYPKIPPTADAIMVIHFILYVIIFSWHPPRCMRLSPDNQSVQNNSAQLRQSPARRRQLTFSCAYKKSSFHLPSLILRTKMTQVSVNVSFVMNDSTADWLNAFSGR